MTERRRPTDPFAGASRNAIRRAAAEREPVLRERAQRQQAFRERELERLSTPASASDPNYQIAMNFTGGGITTRAPKVVSMAVERLMRRGTDVADKLNSARHVAEQATTASRRYIGHANQLLGQIRSSLERYPNLSMSRIGEMTADELALELRTMGGGLVNNQAYRQQAEYLKDLVTEYGASIRNINQSGEILNSSKKTIETLEEQLTKLQKEAAEQGRSAIDRVFSD